MTRRADPAPAAEGLPAVINLRQPHAFIAIEVAALRVELGKYGLDILAAPPPSAAREGEALLRRIADYPWGIHLAGTPNEAEAIGMIEELRAFLAASGEAEE